MGPKLQKTHILETKLIKQIHTHKKHNEKQTYSNEGKQTHTHNTQTQH